MHILTVFDFIPVPGADASLKHGYRKEGVYPAFIRAHSRENTTAAAISLSAHKENPKEILGFCRENGVHFVQPRETSIARRIDIAARYIYALPKSLLMMYDRKRDWVRFIIRYSRTLANVEEYFKSHGKPSLVSALTSMGLSGRIAFLVGRRHQIPFVTRENRTYYTSGEVTGNLKKVLKTVAEHADAILPVSPQLGENIQKVLSLEAKRTMPLQNSVADEFFNPPERFPDWIRDFSGERFIFGGWTNWRNIKRPDLALEAFAALHKRNRKTCLIMAGPMPGLQEKRIETLGVKGAVLTPGSLGREAIHELAHAVNCCIVPSDHDPGNNSVLEAMAAGKPIVVTRCGGSESRITSPTLGRIVDIGDLNGFSSAMEDVLNHYDSFDPETIIKECRRLYSEKAFSDTLFAVYQDVLEMSQTACTIQANGN